MKIEATPAERVGDWMITSSGVRFFPRDPRPDEILIEDIAHHLARICRYGGAVEGYYSVAEHCCLMSDHFLKGRAAWHREAARFALLHDAAEAYIGDLIRPIKPSLPEFAAIEKPIEIMIWRKFGLGDVMPIAVKAADNNIIGDERVGLFPQSVIEAANWTYREGLGLTLQQWPSVRAKGEFLLRFQALFPEFCA
jgi:hypothetical protein